MIGKSKTGVVEVALYRPRPGVTDEQMLEAAEALQREVEGFAGYISRRVLRSEDGQWLDIVEWTSLAEALRADEALMQRPIAQEFVALTEAENAQLLHFAPVRVYEAGPPTA